MFDKLEWVDANLEGAKPSAGDEWTAECPFCGRFGGFYVNVNEEGKGPWVCFKCDMASKDISGLVAQVEDISWAEARAFVMKEAIEFRRRETTVSLLDRIKSIRAVADYDGTDLFAAEKEAEGLPKEFIPVWDGKRWRVPLYMTERGFKRSVLRDQGVGFCNGGRYAHRVVIPIDCPNGTSFTARDVTGEGIPKYLNPADVDHSRLLFGWKSAPMGSDFTLVEGPLDTLKNIQNGLPSLGIGGKFLSDYQLALLFTRPSDVSVTVMLDPEAMADAYVIAPQLLLHFDDVYVARLPDGTDPGEAKRALARRVHAKSEAFKGDRMPRLKEIVANSRKKLQKFL